METRISLEKALEIWRANLTPGKDPGEHIPVSDLYAFLVEPADIRHQDTLLPHVSRCQICRQELKDMLESIKMDENWDMAMPKAAASEKNQLPKITPTEGGKYQVIIRRSLKDANQGVVTVQARAVYWEKLDGRQIILRDGHGRVLIRGVIRGGEISQEVEDLDSIDPCFRIEPDDMEHE